MPPCRDQEENISVQEFGDVTTIKLLCSCVTSKFVIRTTRDIPPTDFMVKIENFSLVCKSMENYISNYFEASGYKWRLSIYPKGDNTVSDTYISVYLMLAEPDVLETGLAINVSFKIFVYDHVRKKFVIFQDANEQVKKFHKLKPVHGIQNLMSTAAFFDCSYGHLVNDSCVFGVEIFVIKDTTKAICLSHVLLPKYDPLIRACMWKFNNFSKRKNKVYYSNPFEAVGHTWRMLIYPRWENMWLAMGMELIDTNRFSTGLSRWFKKKHDQKIYAVFTLLVHDQILSTKYECYKKSDWCIFDATSRRKVNKKFMTLTMLGDPSKSYLLKDTLLVEAGFHDVYLDTCI